MKNYIAKIESSNGSQLSQLAASNIQDAQAQIASMAKATGETSIRYSIQEQPLATGESSTSALLNASGGMLASILVLAITVHYINRHFLGMMRGRK